jgi:hypothetical protein
MKLLRRSLKSLKHKLILSFGEQLGLVVGDLTGDEMAVPTDGMQSSIALSIFKRFMAVLYYFNDF